MKEPLRILCVFAHPDDETLGVGGMLAKYAAEGVETYLLTATRGERGWGGPEEEDPGLEAMGRIREAELKAAASVLGIHQVALLDYIDGDLDQADPTEAIAKIAAHIRRVRPQVVVTFAPDGAYGHPDHIAISQFTSAALACAADPSFEVGSSDPPHRVAKFYFWVVSPPMADVFNEYMGGISMEVDGEIRHGVAWTDWAITTRVEAGDCWRKVYEAALCHASQMVEMGPAMENLPEEVHRRAWGNQTYYRAYSLVNGGRKVEHDLFEGLR